ncbi:hydroxymethylbilane synthase [Granulicella cerasi]|uniref:Porphobilinogen deaminase n=1 Tax=Granulicella cerasi TaxID=741063 RepID=A0ABW1ZD20_9BACT|nr:hydroxymethylbilane synthase [Granulicella cerasi]
MIQKTIRIGSRGSQLALWQAHHIADRLREQGVNAEVEVIRTVGDRMQDPNFKAPATFEDGTPLDAKGIFIKEIEDALLAGRVDLAVHSLKDLPTQLDARFALAAIPQRADARDAFVCEDYWGLHMLPGGSRIGTTSPRRKAMILALRPDVTFVEFRGNIDTRLRKWQEGVADALILASAGLDRIGRAENVHQRFAVDELTPAPGQGALGLETRADDAETIAAVRALNCADTEYATQAERHVLHALGGGCQLPLGAYVHRVDEQWHLHAQVASLDGEQVAHVKLSVPLAMSAKELGERGAELLKQRGALELLRGDSRQDA